MHAHTNTPGEIERWGMADKGNINIEERIKFRIRRELDKPKETLKRRDGVE